jgi:hypothetical protein
MWQEPFVHADRAAGKVLLLPSLQGRETAGVDMDHIKLAVAFQLMVSAAKKSSNPTRKTKSSS